jgi:hypothetical protein
MAYKYPICDVFHWFCKIARFFATEPPFASWNAYLQHGGKADQSNVKPVTASEYSLNGLGFTYY